MKVTIHKAVLSEPIPYTQLKFGELAIGVNFPKSYEVDGRQPIFQRIWAEDDIVRISAIGQSELTWSKSKKYPNEHLVQKFLPGSKVIITP